MTSEPLTFHAWQRRTERTPHSTEEGTVPPWGISSGPPTYSQSLSFPPSVSGGFCLLGLVWGLNKRIMLDMEEAASTWYL